MTLAGRMEPGDIVIDGGNSYYKDDVRPRRHSGPPMACTTSTPGHQAAASGGDERGYCLMIGGNKQAFPKCGADLQDPGAWSRRKSRARPGMPAGTAEQGYLHCGPSGSGHFVKMIHNGIEYGLMQAYARRVFDIPAQRPCRVAAAGSAATI